MTLTPVILLAVLVAVVAATADPVAIINAAQKLGALGVATAGVNSGGFAGSATVATGFADQSKSKPMAPDIAVRGGTVGELLLDVVALQLITSGHLPQLDDQISSSLLPGGLSFVSPSFPGQLLTLRMIMTHTSGLQDVSRFDQSPILVSVGATAFNLNAFGESYFITRTSGKASLFQDIWSSNQPGLTSSYIYARTNVALLAFIVQTVIQANPTLATVATVGALIQERVISPLGMTSTYFILPDGRTPLTQTALSQLDAGKQQEAITFSIHPAYVADYMCLTSAQDLVKLVNSLFVQTTGSLRSVGLTILGSFRQLATTDTARGSMTHQGIGFVQYDASALCSTWSAATGSSDICPFNTARTVFGYSASSEAAWLAVVCQADSQASSASTTGTPRTCVAVTATKSISSRRQSAGIAIERIIGVTSEGHHQLQSTTLNSASGVGVIHPSDQKQDTAYGFTVFGVLIALIFFILFVSYMLEFIIRPLSVTGDVIASAYPKLDDMLAEDDEASPLRFNIGK
jgi:CubicO group peptidase (beta-lactamase class C family)